MSPDTLILVLGDQLTHGRGALRGVQPGQSPVLMAEVASEAAYVPHNRHKIVLVFAAMRHFRDELREAGYEVLYYDFDRGVASLAQALDLARREREFNRVSCCEPGEYRVQQALASWAAACDVDLEWQQDDRFLCSKAEFEAWAEGRKQLRMEYFYREMRRRHDVLLTPSGDPEGGRWNYDRDNRAGWRGKETPPARRELPPDPVTREVITLVDRAFPDNPGDLSRFNLAVTSEGAAEQLEFFIEHCLDRFGHYQDALAEESTWLYHSLVSMYLNIGLLDPLETCRRVESAWRDGHCTLAAAEGFIRQVLGWREYVRGIYWLAMPGYRDLNALDAAVPLPDWFWTADVDLRCLQQALGQSLELGYAHHIQRLMVIGNFALLAGLSVREVCEWYLAVYVDAFEWVELPNTLGMALYGDGGLMASKPYAASGKYIQRQGNHCAQCRYRPDRVTGDGACPYNSLYWAFLDRHRDSFAGNPRMALAMKNWERKTADEQREILRWAGKERQRLLREGG
jgi:deoxyribodipyrimidine photolyase-related protein